MSPSGLAPGEVRVENVWKRFRTDATRHRFGAEESRRLIGGLRGDHAEGWRWVLRDISLEVAPGESMGLIGVNGSGKSTLLKVIAGVVHPFAGTAQTAGFIGSVMDVGATVQNTLTGRENIILYGRMMGWSYRQTRSRTDEILEFAGLTGAADRLVKHYSSGMNVRLGFAMASCIEPSILIVDEALAVGDADFKRKCLQRMREIVDGGATLLFVSHSLEQLQSMCRRALWLDGGVIRESGDSHEVIAAYRASLDQSRIDSGEIVSIGCDLSFTPQSIDPGETLQFDISITSGELRSADLTVGLSFGEIDPFVTATHRVELLPGTTSFTFSFHDMALSAGTFQVLAAVTEPRGTSLCGWRSIGRVKVRGERPAPLPTGVARTSPFIVDSTIEAAP